MELVLVVFLVLMVVGMPIGFAIGISGTMFFLQNGELPITTIVQLPITQSQNINLLAVPLFVFAGSLMNASGITDQLIRLAMLLTGHMRGGMATYMKYKEKREKKAALTGMGKNDKVLM